MSNPGWRDIRLTALLAALLALGGRGVAAAQTAATPSHHHNIRLVSQKITLPFTKEAFAGSGDAAKLANSRCLLCHSKAMVDTQPPLKLDAWQKEIDKMRTAYGCPLEADETAELAAFIAQAANGH